MIPMKMHSDREPIVDEMETEHGEIDEAVNTAVVREALTSPSNPEVSATSSVSRSFHIPWKFMRSCANTTVYTLIGGSSFVTLWFGTKSPSEMTIFQWHIVLCVIGIRTLIIMCEKIAMFLLMKRSACDCTGGAVTTAIIKLMYQLLMPYAMICLQSDSWASSLSYTHRRRAHWVMQLLGSILAFVGSVIMMRQKTVNFNSVHGKFALAALLFTVVSLANGVSSLYARQLRRYMPPRLSMLSHTLIGTLAFLLSSVCLIYGYLKHSFAEWASREFAYVLIAVTCVYTGLICWLPLCKVFKQVSEVVKNKIF